MAISPTQLPILFAGAGALGGALMAGWRRGGDIAAADMMVRDPHPGGEAQAAGEAGALLNPPDDTLAKAKSVIFAVKPQIWRAVAAEIETRLARDATIVSVVAGVAARDLGDAFAGRPVVRAMPTLAVAIGQGSIALWSDQASQVEDAEILFSPLGEVTVLESEDLMHAATAASGSAPAYLYAFIEALEAAAVEAGLPAKDAARLVRATIGGAAALLRQSGEDPAALRRQVTSPGGTTAAALEALTGEAGLGPLMARAVTAAAHRSRELGR